MPGYILPHCLAGEQQRLALMSELLDPMERTHIERLGLRPGWRCLEVGCGNGSIACWLAERVAPTGHVVAGDLDISYVAGVHQPCLEVRQLDITQDAIEQAAYDFVVARAVLHHLPSAQQALERMATALKPGGMLLSIEPDFLPSTVAEPASMRRFWQGWLQWSVEVNIDYFIGGKISGWMDTLGLRDVAGEGHTPVFNGGSPWANYWIDTMRELRPRIIESGHITNDAFEEFDKLFRDPHYWTSVLSAVACWGRKS
jgi:SAM-dependent methyltransferase